MPTSSPGNCAKALNTKDIQTCKAENEPRKKRQNGRERAHFVRPSAAQKVVGSLPPSRAVCAKPSWPRAQSGTYILQCKLHYKLQEKRSKLHGTFKGTIK